MSDPIIVVDTSEICEGELDELKTALGELVEFVEANGRPDCLQHLLPTRTARG